VVVFPRIVTATDPTAVVFVYTKISAVVPVPVLIERLAVPEDAVTGAAEVATAGTNVAFVATAVTTVPVSKPVTAIFSTSAKSTLLSAGTGSATGAIAAVPPVAAEPLTVSVNVFAFADGTRRTVLVNAAALTSAIFFSDITSYISLK
jgi:hypothetical protein